MVSISRVDELSDYGVFILRKIKFFFDLSDRRNRVSVRNPVSLATIFGFIIYIYLTQNAPQRTRNRAVPKFVLFH